MSVKRNLILSNIIISLLVPVIHAEEVSPIIVSATRSEQSEVMTPASITIISREEIEQSGAQHIGDVLRTSAGIQLKDFFGDGSRTTVSMRGFGGNASSNSLIMIDGRRLNNIDLGAPSLNSISLNDVERIEIIHGSAGTLFGDQAVGGVINIITRGTSEKSAEVQLGTGSYSKQHISVRVGDAITDKLKFRVSVEAVDTDNYREHNKKEFLNSFARVDYTEAQGNWFAELQTTNEDLQLPGALSEQEMAADRKQADPSYPDAYNDSQTGVARIGTRQLISSNVQAEVELTLRDEDTTGIIGTINFEQARQSKSFNPRLISNWATAYGEALLTVGIDLDNNDYRIESIFGTTRASQDTAAIYAQLVYALTQDVTATAGLRHAKVENHITDSGSFPTGVELDDDVDVAELGLSWQFTRSGRLFMRADENYRFAKVDEQTFTSPGIVGLQTQTGTSYELGTEWRTNHNQARLLVYRLDLDNEIDYDASAPGLFVAGANVNLPATRRKGAVLEAKTKLTDQLSLSGQVTLVDAVIRGGAFTGKTIPFVAEQQARVAVNYQQSPALGWFIEAHYTGERFKDSDYDNTQVKLPDFTVYNMHVQYSQENWNIGLRINNLFDRVYAGFATYNQYDPASYYPAPERNFELYAKYRF